MTNTLETGYSSYLTRKLEAADTTAYVATVPTVTKGRLFITDWVNKERTQFTGVSGSTLTGLTRGLSKTADPSTAGTGTAWIAGTTIKLVAMHDQIPDKLEGNEAIFSSKIYATTAARDTALWANGAATKPYTGIYVTATGLHYNYNLSSNQWESVDTGTTTPNASTTVAGKVEAATTAESIAWTDTGGTGALTFVSPSDIAKNIQSATFVYWADAWGDDTYVVALTPTLASYTTGQRLQFKVTTANTGACSVDFWPWAKNIKTLDGNDPQTGAIRASQVVTVVYDGTNMILQNEDIASTTNKGIVELATDAEVITGTDETRYTNSKQVRNNSKMSMGNSSRTWSTASGNQTIAHWLWQTPRMVEFRFIASQTTSTNAVTWVGISDGTNNYCIGNGDNGANNNPELYTSYCMINESSSSDWQMATATVDSTNITLSWTKTGTGSADTIKFIRIAHA